MREEIIFSPFFIESIGLDNKINAYTGARALNKAHCLFILRNQKTF